MHVNHECCQLSLLITLILKVNLKIKKQFAYIECQKCLSIFFSIRYLLLKNELIFNHLK